MHISDHSKAQIVGFQVVTNVHLTWSLKSNNMPADHARFTIACFKECSCRPDFQHKCMTADTWAAILNKYCVNDSSLAFNGKQSIGAIILGSKRIFNKN